MDPDHAFDAVAEVISRVCGIDPQELRPERRVADLDIDSMTAGEIVAEAEDALNVDVDFRRIADDWSELTLADLAAQLTGRASGPSS